MRHEHKRGHSTFNGNQETYSGKRCFCRSRWQYALAMLLAILSTQISNAAEATIIHIPKDCVTLKIPFPGSSEGDALAISNLRSPSGADCSKLLKLSSSNAQIFVESSYGKQGVDAKTTRIHIYNIQLANGFLEVRRIADKRYDDEPDISSTILFGSVSNDGACSILVNVPGAHNNPVKPRFSVFQTQWPITISPIEGDFSRKFSEAVKRIVIPTFSIFQTDLATCLVKLNSLSLKTTEGLPIRFLASLPDDTSDDDVSSMPDEFEWPVSTPEKHAIATHNASNITLNTLLDDISSKYGMTWTVNSFGVAFCPVEGKAVRLGNTISSGVRMRVLATLYGNLRLVQEIESPMRFGTINTAATDGVPLQGGSILYLGSRRGDDFFQNLYNEFKKQEMLANPLDRNGLDAALTRISTPVIGFTGGNARPIEQSVSEGVRRLESDFLKTSSSPAGRTGRPTPFDNANASSKLSKITEQRANIESSQTTEVSLDTFESFMASMAKRKYKGLWMVCPTCDGRGVRKSIQKTIEPTTSNLIPCQSCGGLGRLTPESTLSQIQSSR